MLPVSKATAGVGITPASAIGLPEIVANALLQQARRIQGLDIRVSWPTSNFPPSFSPIAWPIAMIVAAFSGNSPARARIPSVPNNFIFDCRSMRTLNVERQTGSWNSDRADPAMSSSRSLAEGRDFLLRDVDGVVGIGFHAHERDFPGPRSRPCAGVDDTSSRLRIRRQASSQVGAPNRPSSQCRFDGQPHSCGIDAHNFNSKGRADSSGVRGRIFSRPMAMPSCRSIAETSCAELSLTAVDGPRRRTSTRFVVSPMHFRFAAVCSDTPTDTYDPDFRCGFAATCAHSTAARTSEISFRSQLWSRRSFIRCIPRSRPATGAVHGFGPKDFAQFHRGAQPGSGPRSISPSCAKAIDPVSSDTTIATASVSSVTPIAARCRVPRSLLKPRFDRQRQEARRSRNSVVLNDHGAIVQRNVVIENRDQQIVGKRRIHCDAAFDVASQSDSRAQ